MLSDRLPPSTLLADHYATVLSLEGLAQDCKLDVGEQALPGLLDILQNDADIDADIGKAVLETLNTLCDTMENSSRAKELGSKNMDYILANEISHHVVDQQFSLSALASLWLGG